MPLEDQEIGARKKLFFYLVMVCLTLLITLVFAELFLRLIYNDSRFNVHDSSAFGYHDKLGWSGIPGYEGEVRWAFGRYQVRINKHGFRDGDFDDKLERARREGAKKILVLGDSHVYGQGIEHFERLSDQLEEIYLAAGSNAVVFNAGISGYGSGQQFRAFELLQPEIKPDVVVLQFCENDIGDSSLPYDHRFFQRVYKPFYALDGKLWLNETVPKRFSLRVRDGLLGRLRLKYVVDVVHNLIEDFYYSSLGISENRRIQSEYKPGLALPGKGESRKVALESMDSVFLSANYEDIHQYNKARNIALLQRLAASCKDLGIRFVLLFDPPPGKWEHPHYREFTSTLKEKGVEILSLNLRMPPWRPWAFVNHDGHGNYLRNYWAAYELFSRLEEQEPVADFLKMTWGRKLPERIVPAKSDSAPYVFGDWGNTENGGSLSDEVHFVIKASAVTDPASRLCIKGKIIEGAKGHLRLFLHDSLLGEMNLKGKGAFVAAFGLPTSGAGYPLFFKLESKIMTAQGARGKVSVESIELCNY